MLARLIHSRRPLCETRLSAGRVCRGAFRQGRVDVRSPFRLYRTFPQSPAAPLFGALQLWQHASTARFIAGMELDDALRVAEAVNRQGISVTLDSLGESVTSPTEAHRAADVYHHCSTPSPSAASTPTSASSSPRWALEQSPDLAESIAANLARARPRHAATSSASTWRTRASPQVTLDIVRRVHARAELRGAIGIVIQAYLYRSQADVEQLLADGIRVRLCKGAYNEPAEVAFPRKSDVDANFFKLAKMLVDSPIYHGLATHDEAMIAKVKAYAAAAGNRPQPLRISDVVWSAPRSAAQTGEPRATRCASTFPLAPSGTPTSCAASPSGPPMFCSWREISSAPEQFAQNLERHKAAQGFALIG